jgi:hypothetical protein
MASEKTEWDKIFCTCESAGTCFGCLIFERVKEHFGTEGIKFIVGQVLTWADDPCHPQGKMIPLEKAFKEAPHAD